MIWMWAHEGGGSWGVGWCGEGCLLPARKRFLAGAVPHFQKIFEFLVWSDVFWCIFGTVLSNWVGYICLLRGTCSFSFSHFWSRGQVTAPVCSRKSQRRLGCVVKTQTDACDKLLGIKSRGGLQHFAGPVRLETSGRWPLPIVAGCSVDIGPRRFHHEKVAAQEARYMLPVLLSFFNIS